MLVHVVFRLEHSATGNNCLSRINDNDMFILFLSKPFVMWGDFELQKNVDPSLFVFQSPGVEMLCRVIKQDKSCIYLEELQKP